MRISPKYTLGFLTILACIVLLSLFSFPDERLHLVFCDVGQGDATLISRGFNQILIDGGPGEKVLQCLADNISFLDKKIEIVILTHPEADHMTGLLSVIDHYEIDTFITGPEAGKAAVFASLVEKIQEKRIRVHNPYAGETIRLGEISLKTLWPERLWIEEKIGSNIAASNQQISLSSDILGVQTGSIKLNQFSLVFLLNYKKMSAILMGDADEIIQDDILFYNSLMPLDILKFPHHGSRTGIKETFLQQISPKEAVISVGKNSYGHPAPESLNLLEKYKVKVRRTDLEGEIHYSF